MAAKVLLINPNRTKPAVAPLAIEYLAEALDAAGHAPSVLDLCFEPDPQAAVAATLAADRFDLIGITVRQLDDSYMLTRRSFLPELQEVIAWVRAGCDAPIVLGGAGFSIAPTGVMRRTGGDFGIVGDGELPLARLATCAERGQLELEECMAIPGLVTRRDGGTVSRPAVWLDLPAVALPRRWLNNRRYFAEGGQAGIETRRGCPRKCIYCVDRHSKGSVTRLRSPEAVAREVNDLLEQGIYCLHTCDSEFNVPGYHGEAVARQFIMEGLAQRLRWYAYCAPHPFTAKTAALYAQAGCVGVNFGADHADERMLASLGREHTPDDIRAAALACRDAGLACMFDLLLGGPGETGESVRRAIGFLQEVPADCFGLSVGVRIYPRTSMERLVRMQGYGPQNPNLRGDIEGNEDMALPVYYLDSGVGDGIFALLESMIGGDRRFLFGGPVADRENYNYDDNQALIGAIAAGARGAYWDILRRAGTQDPPGRSGQWDGAP